MTASTLLTRARAALAIFLLTAVCAAAQTNTAEISGERQSQFRWELFSALNRVNFDLPSRTFGTPNFGRIFSAKAPREIQLGLKLTF